MTTSSRARLFVIPLITLSITLVVLVVAIVIVVIVKKGDGGAATPSASAAQIDRCVVGDWRVTNHREDVSISGVGPVTFTGKGADVHLGADGSGTTDFGHRTRFDGTIGSQKIRLDVTGTLRYHFTALNGTVSFANMTSQATAQTYIDDVLSGSAAPFNGGTDPATYTCKGDTLVESTAVYQTELTRKK